MGLGMVGTPLKRYFEERRKYKRGKTLFLYDIDPKKKFFDDINRARIVFVCVPTPPKANGAVDLSAIDQTFSMLRGEKIVVIKSTVPPGTSAQYQEKFPRFKILFNPEFLTEKNAWNDFLHPNRQLIGWTQESRKEASKVLALLPTAPLASPSRAFSMTSTEAEIVKYASNMFLARKVTFANAIYDIASFHGGNYDHIRLGIAADPRIGSSHLAVKHNGYRGYGGFCFPKDTDALIHHCDENGLRHCVDLFQSDRDFNRKILALQKLTNKQVSVHDGELKKNFKRKNNVKKIWQNTSLPAEPDLLAHT